MDPQHSAVEQVRLARSLLAAIDGGAVLNADEVVQLAELVLALGEWMARGAFAPDWARALEKR